MKVNYWCRGRIVLVALGSFIVINLTTIQCLALQHDDQQGPISSRAGKMSSMDDDKVHLFQAEKTFDLTGTGQFLPKLNSSQARQFGRIELPVRVADTRRRNINVNVLSNLNLGEILRSFRDAPSSSRQVGRN